MALKARSYRLSSLPVTVSAHLLAMVIATLVVVWLLKFRKGLAFDSSDRQKIFNVCN